MGTYTPSTIAFPDGLDELGLRYGLVRFEDESLDDFRKRVALEARSPSGPSNEEYQDSLARKLGLFDTPVFEIDLVLDANGEPLAPDPKVEVTASHLYAWSDYANGTLDFSTKLLERNESYFLRDVHTLFAASTFFTISILDSDYTYKKSGTLDIGSTSRGERVSLNNRLVHDLDHSYLETMLFENSSVFAEEVTALADVDDYGKYYVDYTNGVVFTNDPMSGGAYYTYRAFPHVMVSRAIRSIPLKDQDMDYVLKDELLDEDFVLRPLRLNSRGAKILDEVLLTHPLVWGK